MSMQRAALNELQGTEAARLIDVLAATRESRGSVSYIYKSRRRVTVRGRRENPGARHNLLNCRHCRPSAT